MKKSRPRESFQNEAKEASDAHKVRAVTKILALPRTLGWDDRRSDKRPSQKGRVLKSKGGHPARMRNLLRSMDTEKAQQCFRGIRQLAYPKTMHAQLKTS
jgi:hypothetical protein